METLTRSIETLTQREQEVLHLIISGRSTKQVAADLGISFKTASCHRYHIMSKIGAVNAADLVHRAVRSGSSQTHPLPQLERVVAESCERRRLLARELAKARNLQATFRRTFFEVQGLHAEIHMQGTRLSQTVARMRATTARRSIRTAKQDANGPTLSNARHSAQPPHRVNAVIV